MKRRGTLALFVSIFLSLSTISFGASPNSTKVGLSQDLIYFVMPDRYRNGDSSNDNQTGFDPTSTATFHGGDLKGLTGNCQ